jgi:hypothetical protein
VVQSLWLADVISVPMPLAFLYVGAGLAFAGLATYLQASRSFAISALKDAPAALSVAYDKFKVQTVYPVVGLFIVALVCAVSIPGYYISQVNHPIATTDETPIELTVPVKPVDHSEVSVTIPEERFPTDVTVPVYKSARPFKYTIFNGEVRPITLSVRYLRESHCLEVTFPTDATRKPVCMADIKDNATTLDPPISLTLAKTAGLASVPSRLPQPGAITAAVADPVNL